MRNRPALLGVAAALLIAAQPAPPPADGVPLQLPPAPPPLDLPPPPPPETAASAGDSPADAEGKPDGSRVVRGRRAPAGSSPWQVQLYTIRQIAPAVLKLDRDKPDNDRTKRFFDRMSRWERDHLCGAVLIADGWALTAAHCLVGIDERLEWQLADLRVRMGHIALPLATDLAIERAVIHADYRRTGNKRHDIALLHIVADARTDARVAARAQPIVLAPPAAARGPSFLATGWGITGENIKGEQRAVDGAPLRGSDWLLEGDLRFVPPEQCRKVAAYRATLWKGVICAVGGTSERQDTCQGDSGGPLTRQERLVGLVSNGAGCGRPGVPAIYTRVDLYADWMHAAMAASPPGRISRCRLAHARRLVCA